MRDWQDIWRRLFPGRAIARDVDAEIEFHVDGRVADLGLQAPDHNRLRSPCSLQAIS